MTDERDGQPRKRAKLTGTLEIVEEPSERPSAEDQQRKPGGLWRVVADPIWLTAFGTLTLAAFGLFQVAAYRRELAWSVRPQLTMNDAKWPVPPKDRASRITVAIRNGGVGTALEVRAGVMWSIDNSPCSEDDRVGDLDPQRRAVLAPGDALFLYKDVIPMSEGELAAVLDVAGPIDLALFGRLEYIDILKREHFYEFCAVRASDERFYVRWDETDIPGYWPWSR
jgi:hypothetical protein